MPRSCTICNHLQRTEMEAALLAATPLRDIARQFQTGKDALARHRDSCISATLSNATDARAVVNGETLLSRLKAINAEALAILREARQPKNKNNDLALKAIARLEKQIELEAKLLGELNDAPTVNFNLSIDKLQAVILHALASFPDAKIAVAEALRESNL